MDYAHLGVRIKEERLKLRLTQEKLAEEIGISDSYMGQIERGERSLTLDTLVKLANSLRVTVDYLLSDSVSSDDKDLMSQWMQIMDKRTSGEKQMALDILRVMFNHLDNR